jgi:hypothetical protein
MKAMGHVRRVAALSAAAAFAPALASASQSRQESIVTHPPKLIIARRMGPRPGTTNLKAGTIVPSDQVKARSFANNRDGFGLGGPLGSAYPVRTTDGGADWTTDGPVFETATADGAEAVSYTGTAGKKIEFAYGSSAVDVTANDGKTWWQAFVGELVLDVTYQSNRLYAIVQQQTTSQGTTAVTWVYTSNDGGKHWEYNNHLGGH